MDYNKIIAVATCMVAFSTFLGILIAMLYYIYQIKAMGFIGAFIYTIIYIDLNLIFLYILKRGKILEWS